jgi:hypothetical protein
MKYRGIPQGEYSQLIAGKQQEQDNDTIIIKQIEDDIADFIIFLKERNYSLSSQQGYLDALNHFYEINDIMIRRKKISKFLSNDDNDGEGGGDKPYTHEQIAKLLEFADIRTE